MPPEELPDVLDGLSRCLPDAEAVVVSTCNRVEVYLATGEPAAAQTALEFFAQYHADSPAALDKYMYVHTEAAGIRHLFSVVSGLDSMVVGETQINSQVKEAYLIAAEHGATGKVLNTLMQRAFAVAKQVYRSSEISHRKVSVSSVAADLAGRVFESLAGKTVLVVGAGETGELVLIHLLEQGRPRVVVANRTPERAAAMAERFQGEAIGLDALPQRLPEADIVICCTGSPEPILHAPDVETATRSRRDAPTFIIDIAVPRDVDPGVGEIDNVYLYNIDDLEHIVERNMEQRREELIHCAAIVDREVAEFVEWLQADEATPTIRELVRAVQETKRLELDRLRAKLGDLSESDWQQIEIMADRLANKMTHHPATTLRKGAMRGQKWFVHAARRLFGLPTGDEPQGDGPPG